MRWSVLLPLFVLVSLPACSGGDDDDTSDPGEVTYYGDVAHVIKDRCLSCHLPGRIAPMALDTYDAAVTWAASMRYSVVSREMPPWPVENDGSCQTYQHARYLTQEEQSVFGHWMDNGTPAGDPAEGPSPYQPPQGLGDDALELKLAEPYVPAADPGSSGMDDYRCFLIDPELEVDKFVKAYEIEPGDDRTVHHVLVYSVDPDQVASGSGDQAVTNGQIIETLEASYPGQGWGCFGLAGDGVVPNGLPATWSPGVGVTEYPGDTGIRLRAGNYLVMQVHYNLENGVGPDQTTLRLKLSDSVIREGAVVLYDGLLESALEGTPHLLEPGQQAEQFSWEVPFDRLREFMIEAAGIDSSEVEILGVYPHMHYLGRAMEVVKAGAGDTCLARVPRWDFHWQQFYFYEEPVLFSQGETVRITCTWNTTSRSEPIAPGYGSSDEMCMFGAYLTLPLDLPF